MILTIEDRERFFTFVMPEPNTGCWLWMGGLTEKGYGVFSMRRTKLAHRVSFQIHKNLIPEGKVIDHICRVRCCVNPEHLRDVTPRQNVMENSLSIPAQARFHRRKR